MKKMDFLKACIEANKKGFAEVAPGVYLASQEYMQAEQVGWADEDAAKSIDFSVAPYWITTDDGQGPDPVCNVIDYLTLI